MKRNQNLDHTLHFTDDDLRDNRKGKLSSHQQQTLMRRAISLDTRWRTPLIAGVIFAVIAFVLLSASVAVFIGVAIIAVGLLLIALQAYLEIRNHVQGDLYSGKVKSVTGVLKIEKLDRVQVLHVQDLYFKVSVDTQYAFTDQAMYTLYYAPISGVLLSAKQITGASTE